MLLMYLRKLFLILALTLQSCSFPLDFLKRSEYLVIRTRASYSVVDVDGNQAISPTPTYSTSPVFETVIQTFRSKYTSSTLTTNEPAGSRATAQGLTEILSAVTLTISRSKTVCSDSTPTTTSTVAISTESRLPPNPSYFIVNPEGTPAPPNVAVATTTITIKNDLRPYNTASALSTFPNALVRILSSASAMATARSFSTTLHSKLPSVTNKRPQPSSTTISVYEPTGNPSTSYDRVRNAPYHFPNITSTTSSAGWNKEVRVALVDSEDS